MNASQSSRKKVVAGLLVVLSQRPNPEPDRVYGDLFPWQFRHYGIGPLIGQRTWGGVVGISGSLPFIDGGDMRKPEFAHFAADGSSFIIEGEGVHPDIEVINDPHREYLGYDAQLSKGIEVLLDELKKGAKTGVPKIPSFPNRSK